MSSTREPMPDAGKAESKSSAGTLPEPATTGKTPDGLGYVLTLYVASLTPRSVVAIQSVKDVCEKHLDGQYSLEVIDIYERPSVAKRDQILAAPTLIKRLPLPLRRLIGDMADEDRVLIGLDLHAREQDLDPQRDPQD